jgi:hypothetical protein
MWLKNSVKKKKTFYISYLQQMRENRERSRFFLFVSTVGWIITHNQQDGWLGGSVDQKEIPISVQHTIYTQTKITI